MDSVTLAAMYEFNHGVVSRNLEGISQDESLRPPDAGGNSLNWVLGHVVSYRNRILALLGQPPVWESPQIGRYARGSAPLEPDAETVSLETLRAGFERSQELLVAALDAAAEDELAVVNERGETVGRRLAVLAVHEGYHAGQLGLLRRLLGHAGALG